MGGGKPWRVYRGQPLYHYPLEVLREFCDPVLAVGEALPGCLHVSDENPGQGPLGGLLSGLKASPHDWCLCMAVDMPAVEAQTIRELWANRRESAVVSINSNQPEPLLAIYHRRLVPSLEDYLASGRRSARGWLKTVDYNPLGGFNESTFWNCNTPDDLA